MLLVYLGKDGEKIGDAAISNKLFGAVQDIVFAVRRENGACRGAKCVAPGTGFGQAVSRNPFAGNDLAEIFFFLLFRCLLYTSPSPRD